MGCYVDDLFVLSFHSDTHSLYHHFTAALSKAWNVEDEGPVSGLLSIEIIPSGSTVMLRQTEYISRLLERHAPNGRGSHLPDSSARLSSHQKGRTPCVNHLPQLIADALTHNRKPILIPHCYRL